MREVNAVLTISYRDLMKFVRDRPRLIATFTFPFIFISVLGGSLQANLGSSAGYDSWFLPSQECTLRLYFNHQR